MKFKNLLKFDINSEGLIKNIVLLLKGNLIVSFISLVNLAIIIKQIGSEMNGILILAQSYALLFNDIFNFQSTSAIIKYIPQYKASVKKMKETIKLAIILDLITAIVGFSFAIICLKTISRYLGWNENILEIVKIYIATILIRVNGTHIGIIRVFDKYQYLVNINKMEAVTRLFLYILGVFMDKGIIYFAITDLVITLLTISITVVYSMKILKKEKMIDFWQVKYGFNKEFFKFNIYSNMQKVLDMPVWHITPFIINAYLGTTHITIYKIIEKIGGVITKITAPIANAIYPHISREIAAGKIKNALMLHKKVKKIMIVLGIIGVGTIYIFSFFIKKPIFMNSMLLYIIYITISNAYICQYSMFITLGYIKFTIPILIVGNSMYLLLLTYLTPILGIFGVILSRIVQTTIGNVLRGYILKYNLQGKEKKF